MAAMALYTSSETYYPQNYNTLEKPLYESVNTERYYIVSYIGQRLDFLPACCEIMDMKL